MSYIAKTKVKLCPFCRKPTWGPSRTAVREKLVEHILGTHRKER